MFRLTREVRFGLGDHDGSTVDDGTLPVDGKNGHAGRPAVAGVGDRYFAFQFTIEGEPDPASGYLRNIKLLDEAVRRHAIPRLRALLGSPGDQRAARHLVDAIERADALAGATVVEAKLLLTPFLSLGWCRADEANVIRLSQRFEFSAAHRLHNPTLSDAENVALFGKCNNPHGHGHNYEVQVTIAGEPDAATGTLMPVGSLERLVDRHAIEAFDHKHLNLEVPEFAAENPSVEHIARAIYRRLKSPIETAGRARLASVTVWETPKTWCEYAE